MGIIHFGYEGWRERLGEGFDEENVARVAAGIGAMWRQQSPGAVVYVGYDTRPGADGFARIAAGVLADSGMQVRLSSCACPLPALGWAAANDDASCGGVMVSASGSPADYQGICLRSERGTIVLDELIEEMEAFIPGDAPEPGDGYEIVDIVSPYLENLASLVDADVIAAAGLRVVVDPMFGAASGHLARLLRSLGVEADEIHPAPSATFEGLHPRAEEPWADECEREVVQGGYAAGLILDGDADRSGIIDAKGRLVSHHRMAPLVMGHLVEGRGATGKVVMPMSGSTYIRRQAARLGCPLSVSPIGFSRASEELARGGGLMGVDEFGGIAVPGHLLERDGLMTSLLLVELMATSGMGVEELVADLESKVGHLDYGRRDVRLESAAVQSFRNLLPGINPESIAGRVPATVSHADGLRLGFEDGSWVMVRPSRTDHMVRCSAEAPSPAERDALLEGACDLVRKAR